MKIFGREPVVILAFIAVALKLAAAYGWNVSADQQGAIMAVLSLIVAVATAIVLKTGAVGAAIINLAQGAIALFLAFGLDLTADQQALWMALIESIVALWMRERVVAPVQMLPIEQRSPVDHVKAA